jgi:hypothetical protein
MLSHYSDRYAFADIIAFDICNLNSKGHLKIFLRKVIVSQSKREMDLQSKFNSRMIHMKWNLMAVRMMMEMLVPL